MKTNHIRSLAIAGAGALSAAGILGVTLVSAQSATPTATPSAVTGQAAEKADALAGYLGRLASDLGVSTDALKTAIQQANLQTIDAQEADGTITAEQAAALRERAQADTTGQMMVGGKMGHGPGGAGFRGGPGLHGVASESLATFLGVDADQLRTELQAEGATLASVAAAHGKSRDELKAFLTDEFEAHLADEVADGRSTQEQADQKLADWTSGLDDSIDRTGGLGRFGGRGGHMAPAATPAG